MYHFLPHNESRKLLSLGYLHVDYNSNGIILIKSNLKGGVGKLVAGSHLRIRASLY
jgi:hypothetical protein